MLKKTEIVLLDVETCNTETPKVIELAGLRWMWGRPIKSSHFKETFIDPGQKIDPATQSVHHISDEEIKDAPRLEEIHHEWSEWVGDRVIVAYNSDFDRGALSQTALFNKSWLDAYRGAMHFWSLGMENEDGFALQSLKQQELRYWLKVPKILGDAHRAAADIQVTAHIMGKMMENYLACGNEDSMEGFVSFINGPILHDTFPVGGKIFQGKRAGDIPDWALKKAFMSDSDWHQTFTKFDMLDCLLPEYIRRFGQKPVTELPSARPSRAALSTPPTTPSSPSRWKRS